MPGGWLGVVGILVPLVAGLALIVACAVTIIRDPNLSNRHAIVLAVGALLCVAPNVTYVEVGNLKLFIRDALAKEGEKLGAQGAKTNSELMEIRKRLDELDRRVPGAPAQTARAENKHAVVLIYYSDRKQLAEQVETYLLQKGYSANAVFTDFSELSGAAEDRKGKVGLVFTEQSKDLAQKILGDLRERFRAPFNAVVVTEAKKLSASDVQFRLY